MTLPKKYYSHYQKYISFFLAILLVLLSVYDLLPVQPAFATTSLSSAMVRLDRMKASIASTATVCAKTSAQNGTEAKVLVTFPTGFVLGANTTFTIDTSSTTSWPAGSTAWLGIGTASNVTGQVVTFPSSDLAISTLYCFNITGASAITNPAASNNLVGSIETQTSGNAGIDRSDWATSIISNDQILVSASVSATMTFSLSANAMSLGSLTTSAVSHSSTVNATFSTNASNGVIGWVKGANGDATHGALQSTSVPAATLTSSAYSGTARTINAGTADYLVRASVTAAGTGTGTVTIDGEYNYGGAVNATTGGGGVTSNGFRKAWTSNGTHSGTQVGLITDATIGATSPAATDYADTLTVVVAGIF